MYKDKPTPVWAMRFGYAGVLPQLLFLALAMLGDGAKWIAQAGAFAYAALIFSFLGGIWWAQACAVPAPRLRHFAVAVSPSLIGLACFMPWVLGLTWPGPYLALLGLLLTISPVVDIGLFAAASETSQWTALRVRLSIALGLTTLLITLV